MTHNPADLVDQLQRLRDFARRFLDPEDLGHAVTREIKNAARRALYGDEQRPNNARQETPCRTNPPTTR